jgi:hypothetical protein
MDTMDWMDRMDKMDMEYWGLWVASGGVISAVSGDLKTVAVPRRSFRRGFFLPGRR